MGARFKNAKALMDFKKHMKKRNIRSLAEFIKISVEQYEQQESPLDTLNKEMRYLRKNMKFVEKKVDISTELTRETLRAFISFFEFYCSENEIEFDKDMKEQTEADIVKKIQMGLSWSEHILAPMGLDQD